LITNGDTLSNLQLSYRKEQGGGEEETERRDGGREWSRGRGGGRTRMARKGGREVKGGGGVSILNANKSLKIYGSAIIRKDRAGVMCNKSVKSLK
jgi:hypothetical protein